MLDALFTADFSYPPVLPGLLAADFGMTDFDLPGVGAADPARHAAAAEPALCHGEAALADAEAAARAAGFADGFAAGLARAADDDGARSVALLTTITARLDSAEAAAARLAEDSAQALAELVLAALGAMLPELHRRHGDAEIAALVGAVLPALALPRHAEVRVNAAHATRLPEVLAGLGMTLDARMTLTADAALADGDVRIVWQDGMATRDTAALWDAVQASVREAIDGR